MIKKILTYPEDKDILTTKSEKVEDTFKYFTKENKD